MMKGEKKGSNTFIIKSVVIENKKRMTKVQDINQNQGRF